MVYHCLICDRSIDVAAFPAHVAEHGWDMECARQVGFDWELGTATHEFGIPDGPSLFWMVRHPQPLEAEHDY